MYHAVLLYDMYIISATTMDLGAQVQLKFGALFLIEICPNHKQMTKFAY